MTAVIWANLRDRHGRVHRAVGPWLVLCVGYCRLRSYKATSAPVDCRWCMDR